MELYQPPLSLRVGYSVLLLPAGPPPRATFPPLTMACPPTLLFDSNRMTEALSSAAAIAAGSPTAPVPITTTSAWEFRRRPIPGDPFCCDAACACFCRRQEAVLRMRMWRRWCIIKPSREKPVHGRFFRQWVSKGSVGEALVTVFFRKEDVFDAVSYLIARKIGTIERSNIGLRQINFW
jgi:hypothetical protein